MEESRDKGPGLAPEGHLGPWRLLPSKPGACPTCATAHKPELPHNVQSLYYQYAFFNEHGHWPTWRDAMAHCAPEMRALWERELVSRGVKI